MLGVVSRRRDAAEAAGLQLILPRADAERRTRCGAVISERRRAVRTGQEFEDYHWPGHRGEPSGRGEELAELGGRPVAPKSGRPAACR